MIVDGIIVVIIILIALIGMKKGLTVCAVNFFSLIIALVVAFSLCKPAANFIIANTTIDDVISQNIKSAIPLSNTNVNMEADANLPEGIRNYINTATTTANDAKEAAINSTAEQLTNEAITVLAFIAIFIIVNLALSIVKILSKVVTKLPILKQIDKVGGLVCGALEGIILIYVAFAIISIISPMIKDTLLLKYINESNLGKQMYNNNIVIERIYSK